jgi:small subunit ribosomal protein S11
MYVKLPVVGVSLLVKRPNSMATAKTTTKKKKLPKVKEGNIYIQASYNNTIISVTDQQGNVLVWSSAGQVGFAGARKSTPYAAQQVMAKIIERIEPIGLESVTVYVRGIGSARESAVRALGATGLSISAIRDITPIPHNGVRQRKRRRV